MEKSPSWEHNSRSHFQEIVLHLWNPLVYFHVHKNPPLDTVLSQMNPIIIPVSHLFNIHSNITLPSTASSPK
jgi:hypothetical protein